MKDRLVSGSYCAVLLANFLLYFGFFLLMPVLPFYLVEEFGVSKGMTGVILSSYTVAALTVRPFSGYLLDSFRRKPLYLASFLVFTLIFAGYIVTGSILMFVMLRIVHGLAFGTVTVAGNTIVIDITPSSRRGEAVINTTYVAMYAKSIGIASGSGLFFTCMAAGLAISRLFSGRQVDKGRITQVIMMGMYIAVFSFLGLYLCEWLMQVSATAGKILFYSMAAVLGVGFGSMFPAFNTMFVNLGQNSQRGTATSTYLTSWDVGIGLGLVLGGLIGQAGSFSYAYLAGTVLCVISLVIFRYVNIPHFERNRVR